MQAVEQLSFILVDPLHLDVKHGVGIDLHLVVLFKMSSKLHLVLLTIEIIQRNGIRNSQKTRTITAIITIFL